LEKVSSILKTEPSVKLKLEGHTCNEGTKEHNQKLSEKRAESVKNYIQKNGVEDYRLDAIGFAKDTLAAKPMVLYEDDAFIALASEEVAIRSIFRSEIDTTDPYEGEVRVWQR